ncbi:esterase-like activity of phytase family protein [Marivirga sp.]|uniref:esterase-like activity of phytase family protein n=1 Tax=Marivirga sp. TaxID=2018662 RepID=UPI002D7F2408|nr:esterase-like activity of phytase family protein [Marivirga sp.]HET8859272.1 esterase-like activity of phytase family protein [Marivirga sp.]
MDKIVIDNNELVDSTRIGGLSSIDYLGDNKYIAISDDRSEFSPARIYEMEIDIDSSSILGYSFNKTIFLKNRDNIFFKENELDPESIRYRASTNTYFYTSEGGRTDDWVNPFIWEINEEGELISEVTVPEIFNFNEQKGLRENGGFESLTFENDSIIWYANELPLKEDSEVPGFEDDNYLIRLVRHDIKNDNVLNHFVYNISSLNEKPIPDDGFYINSVPEILYIDKSKLWVLERSYTTGVGNFIKVFEIDTRNASDVKGINALLGRDISTVAKKLILNFSDFNIKLDNIEGMTIGPNLPDGSKSLLFISDDNFSKTQETQLWLFSVNAL